MALLSVDGLSVAYGSQSALEQVSFTLAPGEILGVVGGSGSGKSTLLRAIAGLLAGNARITSGRISFQGAALSERALECHRHDLSGSGGFILSCAHHWRSAA